MRGSLSPYTVILKYRFLSKNSYLALTSWSKNKDNILNWKVPNGDVNKALYLYIPELSGKKKRKTSKSNFFSKVSYLINSFCGKKFKFESEIHIWHLVV